MTTKSKDRAQARERVRAAYDAADRAQTAWLEYGLDVHIATLTLEQLVARNAENARLRKLSDDAKDQLFFAARRAALAGAL